MPDTEDDPNNDKDEKKEKKEKKKAPSVMASSMGASKSSAQRTGTWTPSHGFEPKQSIVDGILAQTKGFERKGGEKMPIDAIDQDDEKEELDYDVVPKFVKMYWIQYKLVMISYNSLLLMVCGVISLAFIFLFVNGEEPYINRANAMMMRNFSVLVPIWGAFGNHSLGEWADAFYSIMFAIGVLYGCLGILGVFAFRSSCYSNEDTSYTIHKWYIVLNVVTLVGLLTVLISLFFGDTRLHTKAKNSLLDKIQKEYQIMGENSFTQALNILMITGNCCGIHGPEDFSVVNMTLVVDKDINPYMFEPKLIYWPSERDPLLLKIPPVCCKMEIFTNGTQEEQYNNMKECAMMNYNTKTSNTVGCAKAFLATVNDSFGAVMGVVIVIFLVLQFYVIFLCVERSLQYLDVTDEYEELPSTTVDQDDQAGLSDFEKKTIDDLNSAEVYSDQSPTKKGIPAEDKDKMIKEAVAMVKKK